MNEKRCTNPGVEQPATKQRVKAGQSPKPPHPSREVAFVAACAGLHGTPLQEFGPLAWSVCAPQDLDPTEALGYCVQLCAKGPKWRDFGGVERSGVVFVVSDTVLPEASPRALATRSAHLRGTYTEAKRMAEQVRWLCLSHGYSIQQLAEIAAAELELAVKETPGLGPTDVMFVVWRNWCGSFGGASALEIGRAICTATFTAAFLAEADGADDE